MSASLDPAWKALARALGRYVADKEFERLQRLKKGEPEKPPEKATDNLKRAKTRRLAKR